MPLEIERKFLVINNAWREGAKGTSYWQGYIGNEKGHAVRVRIAGDKAFLTIKSGTLENAPLSRMEFEYPIPVSDAEQMLKAICEPGQIRKIRYRVSHEGFVWEVDEFLNQNAGLIVAEIELENEHQTFAKPSWLGEEVSHDPRYTNAALSHTPYSKWRKS